MDFGHAFSVDELARLASAIISTGGAKALPAAAAAALARLLSCEGVIAQLPAERALQAVRYGLAGQQGAVALPDSVAAALVDKLAVSEGAYMPPLRASLLLHRRGASRRIVRQAARAVLQQAAADTDFACSFQPQDLLDALSCLLPARTVGPKGLRGGNLPGSSGGAVEGDVDMLRDGTSSLADVMEWVLLMEQLCSRHGSASGCVLSLQQLQDVARALALPAPGLAAHSGRTATCAAAEGRSHPSIPRVRALASVKRAPA